MPSSLAVFSAACTCALHDSEQHHCRYGNQHYARLVVCIPCETGWTNAGPFPGITTFFPTYQERRNGTPPRITTCADKMDQRDLSRMPADQAPDTRNAIADSSPLYVEYGR